MPLVIIAALFDIRSREKQQEEAFRESLEKIEIRLRANNELIYRLFQQLLSESTSSPPPTEIVAQSSVELVETQSELVTQSKLQAETELEPETEPESELEPEEPSKWQQEQQAPASQWSLDLKPPPEPREDANKSAI